METIVCAAPSLLNASAGSLGAQDSASLTLTVSLNEQDFLDAVHFHYYSRPTIESILPTAGPVYGSTAITLSVRHFNLSAQPGAAAECRFGSSSAVAATVRNHSGPLSSVICTSPAARAAELQVYISLNRQDFLTSAVANFTFYEPPIMSTATPGSGPRAGGTTVELAGNGIFLATVDSSAALCRFGHSTTPASTTAGGRVACTSPTAAEAGGADVFSSFKAEQARASSALPLPPDPPTPCHTTHPPNPAPLTYLT